MKESPITHLKRILWAGCIVSVACAPSIMAQIQPEAKPSPSGEDQTVVTLAPFEIRETVDRGYIANDTISAGRLSTNLLNTPADITVLTREFIDDIAAVNINDAAKWLTNSAVAEPSERDFGTSITFRGLPSGANTRNYFQYFFTTEQYIVERLEGSRGPNSILYGDSTSGGQSNAITKRARFNAFQELKAQTDTQGSVLATVDINQPVSKDLSIRVNGLYQKQRSWMEHFYDDRYAGALALTYRPWAKSEIRYDGELGYRDIANRTDFFTDQNSRWDRTTVVDSPLVANPAAGTGLSRITTDRIVVIPNIGVFNFRNFAQTLGSGLSIVEEDRALQNFPAIPRKEFRILPNETNLNSRFHTSSLFFEHTFDNGLVVELAGNTSMVRRTGNSAFYNNAYIDVNRVLPNGATNPNFGKYYSESQPFQYNESSDFSNAVRLASAYRWKGEWGNQTFSLVTQWRDHVFDPSSFFLRRSNGANANLRDNSNLVYSWRYWDQPDLETRYPADDSTFLYDYATLRNSRNKQILKSVQFNTVGEYFGSRLHVVAGFRYDDFYGEVRDATTWDARGKDPTAYRLVSTEATVTSVSLGAVYFVVPSMGVYANYSEGFLPSTPSFPSLDGSAGSNLTQSDSLGAGLRLNLLDGRLVGSVGYYQSREYDRPQNIATAGINQIWQDIGMPERQIVGGSTPNYIDSFETKGRGWEVDFTANLSRGLRFKANFALPQNEQANSAPASKAYLAANRSLWAAGANDPTNPNASRIATNLANYENTISSLVDGRTSNLTYKYRANAFGTYTILSGKLKGARVGGGINLYGKRIIGSPTNRPFDYIYTKAYNEITFLAGYEFDVAGLQLDIQLNISNALDYDDPIYTSVGVYNGNFYRNNYRYLNPRQGALTVTAKF